MKPAPRRWDLPTLAALDGHGPLLGRILGARGVDAGAARLLLAGDAPFHDPMGLRGMAEAVATLREAITEHRRIAIYGDYDADGVTACAMLTLALREIGADAIAYIPNRMSEGYGLHVAALAELADRGVDCVVTVDCGTSSVAAAASRPASMRLIITDHHLPLQPDGTEAALAPADALINPKQPGCGYAFDGLAGAGVAWKLVCALEEAGLLASGAADRALPLAALGTVADMMPLTGENRRIVRDGLGHIGDSVGLHALCEVAGVSLPPSAADLGFGLGPRINAAGRMEDARLALELLLCDEPAAALALAGQLNGQNAARQQAVRIAQAEAEQLVADLDDDVPAIVLGDPGWPMGIVGLVAGRLCERYARPTFVACLDPAEAKGSARTIRQVHVVRALDGAADTLIRYGGHAMAAGFSLEATRFAQFREAICASVAVQLGDTPRERVFHVDAEASAAEATIAGCRELAALEPCGQGNHTPTMMFRNLEVINNRTFGGERQHVGATLGGDGAVVEVIAFHHPGLDRHLPRGRRIDICATMELDSWRGEQRVRLKLRDLRPAREAVIQVSGAPVASGEVVSSTR